MKQAGWEQTLRAHIATAESTPFRWGENDCCLFVARYVDAVSGTEHTKEWYGQYGSESEAQRLMESRGLPTPSAIVGANLRSKPVTHARFGDIVSFEGGAVGICAGRKSYFFVEGRGLSTLPTIRCKAAWEV